ncbi:MAG: LuxR C-terminal-related transcriptional regulator [Ignavibacteria bacterium]
MKKIPSSAELQNINDSHSLISKRTRGKKFPDWKDTFDSAMDIIALISKDYTILKMNKAGYKNLAAQPKEVIGKKCYKVIHDLDAPIHGCACRLLQESGQAAEGEIFDRGRYFLTTAAPIFDKNKDFIAFTHTVKDITKLREAENSLKNSNKLLAEKIRKRAVELVKINEKLKNENIARKKSEKALKESADELQNQRLILQQKNAALNEIILQIEIEKNKIKDNISTNIERVILPTLEKLNLQDNPETYVRILKDQLEDITSEYASKINRIHYKLTPREIELCNFIKSRLSSKEIADLLNISLKTVNKHRRNIRKKLELINSNINLASYLAEIV